MGQFVHLALHRIGGLWGAKPTESARIRMIRKYRMRTDPRIGNGIRSGCVHDGTHGHGVKGLLHAAKGYIGSLVQHKPDIHTKDPACRVGGKAMADIAGMPLPCRAENLFPVQLKKHRPAGLQSENARDDADVQSGILLTAEAASDERTHHMQLVLRDAEYRSQIPPGGVDGLRRTCQRQTACKRIRLSDADVRLKVTVFHHRRLVVVFDDDGRFRKRLLHVATVECYGSEQIPPLRHRMLFMDEGRTILHGLARIVVHRQGLVFHADELDGLPGRLFRFRRENCHRVAFVAGLHVRNDRLVRTQQPIGVPPR